MRRRKTSVLPVDHVGSAVRPVERMPEVESWDQAVVVDVQLQAWAAPGRVHLAGEVDVSNVEAVSEVLSQATPVAGELVVDMDGLTFIDVGGTARVVELARRLGPGERLIVIRPPRQFLMILQAWEYELDVREEAS